MSHLKMLRVSMSACSKPHLMATACLLRFTVPSIDDSFCACTPLVSWSQFCDCTPLISPLVTPVACHWSHHWWQFLCLHATGLLVTVLWQHATDLSIIAVLCDCMPLPRVKAVSWRFACTGASVTREFQEVSGFWLSALLFHFIFREIYAHISVPLLTILKRRTDATSCSVRGANAVAILQW
jgi:hypothetical protein